MYNLCIRLLHRNLQGHLLLHRVCMGLRKPGKSWNFIAVLSIRAGSRPKQPATGQSLAGYFLLTLLLILVRNLKWGKDPTKIIETSISNVWVKIKPHFRSLKRVYLSHARWKLIEGFWNACDIFREQNPARNRLKIMKRSRKNNCKTSGSNVRV